jgi:excisionase family DNA binding protein
MAAHNLEDLITQAEAARLRGVSREAIYGLVARKKLEVIKIGGQKFVRRSDVENYTPEIGGRPITAATQPANGSNAALTAAAKAKKGGKK